MPKWRDTRHEWTLGSLSVMYKKGDKTKYRPFSRSQGHIHRASLYLAIIMMLQVLYDNDYTILPDAPQGPLVGASGTSID